MNEIWTMGELLVEVMRPKAGMSLGRAGVFLGPYPSGAPGIFIDTVARLGHSAAIVSGVGQDDFGQAILERLARDGVDTAHVRVVPNRSTGVAFVTYFRDGSRRFIFHWDGTPAVMAEAPATEAIQGARWLHVMGCSLMANERFRQEVFTAVERFAAAGAGIAFDPNIRFELLAGRAVDEIAGPVLRRCRVLFPGEREAQLLGGAEDTETAVRNLFRRHPLEILVLKRGRRGCAVYRGERGELGERWEVPAFRVREVDPTGAGDCFDAGFLCGLLEGRPLRECARLASAAGALAARAFGPMEGRITPRTAAALLSRR